ncbi:MAG TPA: hypothetical protein VH307_31145 [Streptosporangiaceae bacterium]|nr:hypothetical protein [Streptosporangiaceae bacterium]
MTPTMRPGVRLRSAVCDVEVIVVRASVPELDLRCGGQQMQPVDRAHPRAGGPMAGFDAGTQLGKRYVDPGGLIELLCTKSGPSSLSVGDQPMTIKDAKPLPASD